MGQVLRTVMDVQTTHDSEPVNQDPDEDVYFGEFSDETGAYDVFHYDRLTTELELGRCLERAYGSLAQFEVCIRK